MVASKINNTPTLTGRSAKRFVKLMNERPSKEKRDYWKKVESQKKCLFRFLNHDIKRTFFQGLFQLSFQDFSLFLHHL